MEQNDLVGNTFTAAESMIKSDEIKLAVAGNRIRLENQIKGLKFFLFSLMIVAGLAFVILVCDQFRLSDDVANLNTRITKFEVSATPVTVNVAGLSTQKPADQAPITPKYAVEISEYAANTSGSGAFRLELRVVESQNGQYVSTLDARIALGHRFTQVLTACDSNTRSYAFDPVKASISVFGRLGKPVSSECWTALYIVTGRVPYDRLSSEAVQTLKILAADPNEPSRGFNDALAVGEDGRILGYWTLWDGDILPSKDCQEAGLMTQGDWDGKLPYFVVKAYNPSGVFAWLFNEAMTGEGQWGPELPTCKPPSTSSVAVIP